MSGTTDEEHLANLEAALECPEKKRTALREGNCEFMMDSINFLSHILDKQGISPLPQKVDSILQIPRPENQTQLTAHLVLLGYYRRFLPNLSSDNVPLAEQYVSKNANGHRKQSPGTATKYSSGVPIRRRHSRGPKNHL